LKKLPITFVEDQEIFLDSMNYKNNKEMLKKIDSGCKIIFSCKITHGKDEQIDPFLITTRRLLVIRNLIIKKNYSA
jgi:hypothetical protein